MIMMFITKKLNQKTALPKLRFKAITAYKHHLVHKILHIPTIRFKSCCKTLWRNGMFVSQQLCHLGRK